jgi:hypothetical protein
LPVGHDARGQRAFPLIAATINAAIHRSSEMLITWRSGQRNMTSRPTQNPGPSHTAAADAAAHVSLSPPLSLSLFLLLSLSLSHVLSPTDRAPLLVGSPLTEPRPPPSSTRAPLLLCAPSALLPIAPPPPPLPPSLRKPSPHTHRC